MKLPEYALKVEISLPTSIGSDPATFPAGTLCFPFWSEHNLPEHIREELREKTKFAPPDRNYIMCIIGRTWVPVPKNDIRQN